MNPKSLLILVVTVLLLLANGPRVLNAEQDLNTLSVLFLGDDGPHRPLDRYKQLTPVLAPRGIELTYSNDADDLDPATLARFDGLIIYANTTTITPAQEKALLDYVASGKGFIPLHCASYCFHNSPKYIELVGAQFKTHGTGEFYTRVVHHEHPITRGIWEFLTWDETYVHTEINPDCTVLQVRDEGGRDEPWTWVRTHGKGRVFYTAYGHDTRTFGNPGFHALVERGIRWACGDDRVIDNGLDLPANLKPFEYTQANIPFYAPNRKGGGPSGADGWNQMQLPLDSRESMKHIVVPRGFRLELFAAEPEIHKAIAMAWDERGRLWIPETVDYPNNMQPEGQGNDQIKICEDTDGDGRADTYTIFADKLSIPTSLCFAAGGLIVHQAPETLFLKDTNGDDRADVRKVLFRGWGTHDTHAGPSNLRWGLDNWVWGMVGYSGFNGTLGGEQHRFSQGFYRFRPAGSKLEYIRSTNNNTWGLGLSEEGLVFGSTANNNPSVYMPIANRYYEKVRGWSASRLGSCAAATWFYPITEKIRQVDAHGRFTSGAGHALYTARHYPRHYWNNTAFVAGPTGHLLGTFAIERVGSDMVTRNSWNMIASDDEWVAPIMAEVGPDGAVWVIDWYNYIVQHNPTPHGFKTGKGNAYVNPLRDKIHGRIYRLVHERANHRNTLRLDNAPTEKLVTTLKNDNMLWRMHAQRLLVEDRKVGAIPALIRLAGDRQVDEVGLNTAVIHALWTLHGLGALDGSNVEATRAAVGALSHPSAGVRRNALEVIPRSNKTLMAILARNMLMDADAQVRLAAFLALSEYAPSKEAGTAIALASRQSANADDRWIPQAAISAAAAHDLHFLTAILGSRVPAAGTLKEMVLIVSEHYARGGPVDSIGTLFLALVDAEPSVSQTIIAGLDRGWPKGLRARFDGRIDTAMAAVFKSMPAGSKSSFIKLTVRLGSESLARHAGEIAGALFEEVTNEKKSDGERMTLARQLVEFKKNDDELVEDLLAIITPRTSPELARGILEALGESNSDIVGATIVEALGSLTPAVKPAALRVLLQRTETTGSFLDAVDEGIIQITDLSLEQQQSLAKHPDKKTRERALKLLEQGGSLPDPDRQNVLDRLMPLAGKTGNAGLGKKVYDEFCSKCHIYNGEGTDIGPDLTGMAVHPKEELLTQVLDPSRSFAGNYRQYTVVTKDGRIIGGLLASETRTSMELYDVEGKKHVVLREDINQIFSSNKSLMPEGFEDQLTEEQFVNLLEFLTQRGKYLPIPLDKYATIVSTRGMFYNENNLGEGLIFPDWKPKVFGGVPFYLVDPKLDKKANVIMLHSTNGKFPPLMPRSVVLPCNSSARAIHLLSGVSGWGSKGGAAKSVSMIVRLRYVDGTIEDHQLINDVHFADYIGHFHVPESKFAFDLRGRQIRYLAVRPQRADIIKEIELVKGRDSTAPVVMAVTVEGFTE